MRFITPPFVGAPTPPANKWACDRIWLQEPNLLIPGKKPIGSVTINWTHPITKNLRGVYFLTQNAHHNLAGFGDIDPGAGPRINIIRDAAQIDDAVNYELSIPGSVFGLSTNFTDASWSILFVIDVQKSAVANNDMYLVSADPSDTNQDVWYINNSGTTGQLRTFSWASNVTLTSVEPDANPGVFNILHGVMNKATNTFVFGVDGVTTSGAEATSSQALSGGNVWLFNDQGDITRRILAAVRAMYIWARPISDTELRALLADPYQFLEVA